MVFTILGTILSIIAALLPVFLTHMAESKQERDVLTKHTTNELHIGTDSVRKPPTV